MRKVRKVYKAARRAKQSLAVGTSLKQVGTQVKASYKRGRLKASGNIGPIEFGILAGGAGLLGGTLMYRSRSRNR